MKKQRTAVVKLESMAYGGQALGTLEDGKKIFVWGGLPGETVEVEIIKSKKTWGEGITTKIITPSKDRVAPQDPDSFLSTSPWQIIDYPKENALKRQLIEEQFAQHHIDLKLDDFTAPEEPYGYRNKVEFSFWWSNETNQLDLAFYQRSAHYRIPVEGTSLAQPEINQLALQIRDYLRKNNTEGRQLKTLLIRCNQARDLIAELYVRDESLQIGATNQTFSIEGFHVHYSNPQSPASVKTKVISENGALQLKDRILNKEYTYSVDGFFQVNLPMYEAALKSIKSSINPELPILDLYSGVGSIGLSLAEENQKLTLIEVDERCSLEAEKNAETIKPDTKVLLASASSSLDYIQANQTVIVDPPRAGLHEKVVGQLLKTRPATIIYLSCNPATQARDIAQLIPSYKITSAQGFNFFPRTPHIESLVILARNL